MGIRLQKHGGGRVWLYRLSPRLDWMLRFGARPKDKVGLTVGGGATIATGMQKQDLLDIADDLLRQAESVKD